MSENNKGEENSQKGNDWEVVALTESAYAAAPGPRNILDNSDINLSKDDDSETARVMFMSGHFGLSPSVLENLPLGPEYNEKLSGEGHVDHDVDQISEQQGSKSDMKEAENLNIEGLISDEFSGVPQFDEKIKGMSFYSYEVGDVALSKSIDKEQAVCGTEKSSYDDDDDDAAMPFLADEGAGIVESFESLDDAVKSNVHTHVEEDRFSEPNDLPCDAWWRKHAASLYGHAKNANPYWSLIVAAAVIGLVIIGRRWHCDRPQVIQLKSQLTLDNKEAHWILSPMGRLKGVNLGGRHSSCIGLSSVIES